MDFYYNILKWISILWVFGHYGQTVESACQSPEDCLYRDLFADYNVRTRPVLQPNDTVQIYLTFSLEALKSIDEKNEVMNVIGLVIALWQDPRLEWDPSNYSGTELLTLQSTEVWLPDLALVNSADTFFQKSHREDFFVLVTNHGLVRWSFGGTFSTGCPIDLSQYPLDSQTCMVEFFNWGYTKDYLNILPVDFVTANLLSNALWDLKNTTYERLEVSVYNGEAYVGLRFNVTWSRKTLYYQYNLILPIVLLALVSLGTLSLPPDCGERLSLAITVLLSYAVFLIVIMDSTPINSNSTPIISQFVIVAMVVATTILIESLFVVNIFYRDGRPPRWLRRIMLVYLAQVCCTRREETDMEDKESDRRKKSSVTPETKIISLENSSELKPKTLPEQMEDLSEISQKLSRMLQILEDKEQEESYRDEWRRIGKLSDRLMFVMCIPVLVISVIVIFVSLVET